MEKLKVKFTVGADNTNIYSSDGDHLILTIPNDFYYTIDKRIIGYLEETGMDLNPNNSPGQISTILLVLLTCQEITV
jgi:hypothetical protein